MTEVSMREHKLPDEILETQKARSSLLQWKLVIVAALGAAGLGLTSTTNGSKIGLLALIPFVSAYVDLLCTNLKLRIILIGTHFDKVLGDPYECRVRMVAEQNKYFALEDWALYGSTYLVSAVLSVFAIAQLVILYDQQTTPPWYDSGQCYAVLISSIIGFVLAFSTNKAATKKIDALGPTYACNSE